MITSLISGKLIADPKSGQSSNGKAWCRALVSCPTHASKESDSDYLIVSLIAFGDEAEKLCRLGKGDSISATGSTKINQWQNKDGETKSTLDIVVNHLLTPYILRQKRYQPEYGERAPKDLQDKFLGRHGSGGGFHDQLNF